MKKNKVVVIGGGSSYTPELIEGFILRNDQFHIDEFVLVDVQQGLEKVSIIEKLAQRMFKEAGLNVNAYASLDRRSAFVDADYVIVQMRVGLLDARIKDERISNKHGLIGQETNGAGGMFKGLRTVPVILDIVKDVQEICPNAWIVNFSNPSGMINEAVIKYTKFEKFVSLCNVPINMHYDIAKIMNLPKDELRLELYGLNHYFYVTDVFHNGISIKSAVIDEYCNTLSNPITMNNIDAYPWDEQFIRGINAIPCPYHNYYYFTKEELAKEMIAYGEGNVRAEKVHRIEESLFELYKDENLKVKPKELESRGGALYSDAACSLVCSIHNDTKDLQYVNTLNRGANPDLPFDSGVECTAVISRGGIFPLPMNHQNAALRGQIQMMKAFEQTVVDAAVLGNKELAISALNMNPLVDSMNAATAVFEELLEAHKEYLPNFFKED